ncbi:MAG: response regulator, partial [Betaproteobacteria bacterium]|nr:response regulator [Betaproteobacteria bacterium]
QAGRLRLNRVDFALQSILDELERHHAEKAQNKGLVLRFVQAADVPARVHADRARWLQILNNLVNNAIKFTHQGCVSVQVMAHNEHLRFEVQDEGPGIPLARQEHIFRRFEHADVQTNLADAGTGLGLTLCEKLVTLQGGRIGVVSQEGHGARFWFEVPWEAAKTTALSSQEAFDHLVDEPLRILVVDDSPVNLMVAQLQLQKCWPKAQVTTANSGTQALGLLDRQLFDVALIDMIMPDMNGMQVTQQIRHHFPAATARMPILALTANTNPVDRERWLAAGMNDVLHKPMDSAELLRVVAHHISMTREGKW